MLFSNSYTSLGRCPAVRGELLPRVGYHYWETVVAGCKAYRIGVAYQTEPHDSTVGDSSTSWCLHCVPTSIRLDTITVVLHSCYYYCFSIILIPRLTVTAVGLSCFMTAWNQTSLWQMFPLVSALYWTSLRAACSSSTLRMASVWAHSSKPLPSLATLYSPWRDLETWSLRWSWRSQSLPRTGSSDEDEFLENLSLFLWPWDLKSISLCVHACHIYWVVGRKCEISS